MRIVHVSDLHGQFYNLPEADLYIITGDMLDNYPDVVEITAKHKTNDMNMFGHFGSGWTREINPEKEKRLQSEWYEKKFRKKKRTLRTFFGSPDAPVICVRGNHDFVDLGPMFEGEVYEISKSCYSYNVLGLDVGGFRGINYIAGEWSDETPMYNFYDMVRRLPKNLDLMVTHSPPYNILDGRFNEKYGIQAYAAWITEKIYLEEKLPKLFCFGHIHNDHQVLNWEDGTIFSNAATTHNIIEL